MNYEMELVFFIHTFVCKHNLEFNLDFWELLINY